MSEATARGGEAADGTGTTEGQGGAPPPEGIIAPDRETVFLGKWAQGELAALRREWGGSHLFGVGYGMFAAWRRDGSGRVLRHEDPAELARLVGADRAPGTTGPQATGGEP